ncbi:hypothetical protein I545_6856 [Mycobacterium kansasii 662]|uniref:Uncharacterized protein n=1 Tax=Mycobacterium kansasii 662 TaxID=1299326 RepID=X7XS16_MYCKA|nr:hypothetical protein [Mycobacterium kansasii]ETZ97067.1 hypothetical protein I545_6856 [Mycobacterium kansasii 662]
MRRRSADLAALAAAARLPDGGRWLARGQRPWRRAMGVGDAGCAVRDLDVVVTVEVPVAFAGVARAAARRAGPAASESPVRADC